MPVTMDCVGMENGHEVERRWLADIVEGDTHKRTIQIKTLNSCAVSVKKMQLRHNNFEKSCSVTRFYMPLRHSYRLSLWRLLEENGNRQCCGRAMNRTSHGRYELTRPYTEHLNDRLESFRLHICSDCYWRRVAGLGCVIRPIPVHFPGVIQSPNEA